MQRMVGDYLSMVLNFDVAQLLVGTLKRTLPRVHSQLLLKYNNMTTYTTQRKHVMHTFPSDV
jgi:hypothetical protein